MAERMRPIKRPDYAVPTGLAFFDPPFPGLRSAAALGCIMPAFQAFSKVADSSIS
jgi:hypothetical protein